VSRAGGATGAVLRTLAILGLVLGAVLAPFNAPPAHAAEPDLSVGSSAVYTLIPDKGLVHVVVDVTATNNKPNLVQQSPGGTRTTRYFFQSATIAVQPEAVDIRAGAGRRTKLETTVTTADTYLAVRVDFVADLFFGQTTKFRVEYDLPGGAPRSESDIRVGAAFATFYAWAFGDQGDVRIDIPAGYKVDTRGMTVTKSVANGVTSLAATAVTAITDWYVVVVADRHDALTQDRLDLPDGEHLVVRGWPEDEEWRTRVRDLLRIGLPVLFEKVGLPWPVAGDIEVAEVHTPLLEGYAGVFYTNEDRIEISEDLDELTIIHEASHAWFNQDLFVGRWIDEGFANEYASRVLDEVSMGGLGPDTVSPTDKAAVDLNTWQHPGRIADEETNLREHYGYEASWTIIRALVDEIGEDGMRAVFAAARAKETAYRGAGERETVTIPTDWRRFLDLLEGPGGSKRAEDLFRRWVVDDAQAKLLDTRVSARKAYARLVDDGLGWLPGYVVRGPLDRWQFSAATDRIVEARGVLQLRNQINEVARRAGATPPEMLRVAYEGETKDLDTVRQVATDELAAANALAAAKDAVAADRDLVTSIGLTGEDPDAGLAAATEAFAAGDLKATNDAAAAVTALMAGADDTGRTRALVGGLVGAGLVAAGVGGAVALGRRRRGTVAPATVAPAMYGPWLSELVATPETPDSSPEADASYATLGGPRSAEPAAEEPAPPGRPEGDDVSQDG